MSDIVTEDQAVASVTAGRGQGEPVYFNGSVAAVCKMVFKFTLLTILTLGIYRFWAKTKLRRYFWSQTEFDGDRFEYHGTPKELFIGFLIVVAILAPIIILSSLVSEILALGSWQAQILFQAAYLLSFLFLIGLATYRVLKYRLSRTSWRGVHFGLDGSSMRYALMNLAAFLAGLLTLGLATPWLRNILFRYKFSNMRFGSAAFTYSGVGSALAKKWFVAWAVSVIPLVAVFAFTGLLDGVDFWEDYKAESSSSLDQNLDLQAKATLGMFVLIPLAFIMFLWYRVVEFRYLAKSIGLADCEFNSSASFPRIFGILLWIPALTIGFYIIVVLLFIGVVFAFVGFSGQELNEQTLQNPQALMEGMGVAGVLVMAIFGLVLICSFFVFPAIMLTGVVRTKITRAVLTSIVVTNSESLVRVTHTEQSEQKYGEGLADAFDVGAF